MTPYISINTINQNIQQHFKKIAVIIYGTRILCYSTCKICPKTNRPQINMTKPKT